MSRFRIPALFLLAALLMLGFTACSDSDDPVDPGGGGDPDTTAPQVTGVYPGNGEAGVDADEEIVITFSEPMDTATSAGQVSLSAGAISSLTWADSRNLVIDHAAWSEGAHITVTIGTGLADVAGNTLAAAFTFDFYVYTAALTVLETNPADGATGINRDSNIQILFTQEVTASSFSNNVTVTDPNTRTNYLYNTQISDQVATITLLDRLAASTEITVTVGAGVATWGGTTLDSEYVFSFTTGEEVDETPPHVVSSYPEVGATCAPDVGYFQVTFSEPMDPNSFEPSSWNAELVLLIFASNSDPAWNDDFTQVTVPLPSPLPDGLPMEISFGYLTDANGVTSIIPWNWHATVSGTPDYYPVEDGLQMVFSGSEDGGDLGKIEGYTEFLKIEMQQDNVFHLVRYEDGFVTPSGDYEIYQATASAIMWLGFAEDMEERAVQEMLFDTPVRYLPLPLANGTWSDDTSVTVPGEGVYTATLSGTVAAVGQIMPDKANVRGDEEIYFTDVYRVIRTMDIALDGTPAMTNVDTTWYSPTLGPIMVKEYEENSLEGNWWSSEKQRIFAVDDR